MIKKSHNVEHVHEVANKSSWGLNEDIKLAIKHLYMMGTSTAIPISYSLRDKAILSELANIDVENYYFLITLIRNG